VGVHRSGPLHNGVCGQEHTTVSIPHKSNERKKVVEKIN
jgi:hypothetical protein